MEKKFVCNRKRVTFNVNVPASYAADNPRRIPFFSKLNSYVPKPVTFRNC